MSISQRRLRLVVLLGLLVVAAGCQSASTDAPTEGPTPDAPAGPTTGEPTATAAGVDLDEHQSNLRAAGSVTVRRASTMTVRRNGTTRTRNQTRYAELDFESGRAYTRLDPLGGSVRERYRPGGAAGKTYEVHDPEANPEYVDPERSGEIAESQFLQVLPVDESALERRGSGTVDGVSGTVYVADSFSAVKSGAYDSLSASDVTAFRVTYVVGDAGAVRYQRINLTAVREGAQVSELATTEFSAVGSTTVTKPEWFETESTTPSKPDYDDIVMRTYDASGDRGRVELEVAAAKSELDRATAVGPRISDDPFFQGELFDRYRAGPIAHYDYQVGSVKNVTISVHYDGPVSNESDLQLLTVDPDTESYTSVNSTVNQEEDVVSVTFTDSLVLDYYEGQTFVVLQSPQFDQAWAERNSDDS